MTTPQPLRPPLGPPQLAPVGAIGSDLSGGPLPGGLGGNPILDEIDQAHASLSPPAKDAIDQAHGILGLKSTSGGEPSATTVPLADGLRSAPIGGLPATTPAQPLGPPPADQKTQDLSPALSLGSKSPMTGAQSKLQRIQSTGSRVSQIHNPWARVPLQILDAIGTGFFPNVAAGIPGTTAHHRQVEGAAQREVNTETEEQKAADAAKTAEAEQGLKVAQTGHANAQTQVALHPADKEKPEDTQKTIVTDQGVMQWNPDTSRYDIKAGDSPEKKESGTVHQLDDGTLIIAHPDGKATPVTVDGKPVKGKAPEGKEGELPLGPERIEPINQALTARFQVLHPGQPLPAHYVLSKTATQKDFDRTDKLIEGEEKAFGTKENQAQTAELRKQTMALAAGNREHKDEHQLKSDVKKEYQPAMDAAQRFNIMSKNYEDAVKTHDQQAMLSLLANHIGMTLGAQKGARITKDILHEAEQSRPWLQGITTKFDKDGVLSGVTLSPPQMRQMVDLGREMFSETTQKARNGAKYLGAKDDGPERTPNKATINHYTALANGDAKKAKELAAADGWSVQ